MEITAPHWSQWTWACHSGVISCLLVVGGRCGGMNLYFVHDILQCSSTAHTGIMATAASTSNKERAVYWLAWVICSNISWNNAGGIRDRSLYVFIPWVPVLLPLGAAIWQGIPFLHIGRGLNQCAFVHMSVGFILSSPYWQYVTVWRYGAWDNRSSFLRTPLGFSMNHHVGCSSSIRRTASLTSSIDLLALSLLGSYPLYPPPQFFPIAATLNPSHGGDAHSMSGWCGKSPADRSQISATKSWPSISS